MKVARDYARSNNLGSKGDSAVLLNLLKEFKC